MNGWVKGFILTLAGFVFFFTVSIVSAGSVVDQGQLQDVPSEVNYIVWINTGSTPEQLLTEDGYNSELGTNKGYETGIWRFSAGNFPTPPNDNANISMIFGGRGGDIGSIWEYDFIYDNEEPVTAHGTVGTKTVGNCPAIQSGSQDENGETINWTGDTSQHLIYRSVNASGASNGASNGRYDYVATIPSGIFTYLDTTCPLGTDCWHVVIPSSNGTPVGCHSEESSPTAITLNKFSASNTPSNSISLWIVIGLSMIAFAWLGLIRNNEKPWF